MGKRNHLPIARPDTIKEALAGNERSSKALRAMHNYQHQCKGDLSLHLNKKEALAHNDRLRKLLQNKLAESIMSVDFKRRGWNSRS